MLKLCIRLLFLLLLSYGIVANFEPYVVIFGLRAKAGTLCCIV